MTTKQIEASREIRLWCTQVVLPIVGAIIFKDDIRDFVKSKVHELKDNNKPAWWNRQTQQT